MIRRYNYFGCVEGEMIYKLKDNRLVLQLLYEDCVRYAEEISLIEEDYLWPGVSVYVDNPQSIKNFLIISLASFNGTEKTSARTY